MDQWQTSSGTSHTQSPLSQQARVRGSRPSRGVWKDQCLLLLVVHIEESADLLSDAVLLQGPALLTRSPLCPTQSHLQPGMLELQFLTCSAVSGRRTAMQAQLKVGAAELSCISGVCQDNSFTRKNAIVVFYEAHELFCPVPLHVCDEATVPKSHDTKVKYVEELMSTYHQSLTERST